MNDESIVPRLFKKFNSIFVNAYKGSRLNSSNFFYTPDVAQTFESQSINSNDISYGPRSSNQVFREHIDRYPACKKCLEDNGYDFNCFRINDGVSEECSGADINYCQNCSEDCYMFCDPNYGNTDSQFLNTAKFLNIPPVSDFMGNLYGSTFQNENFWKGYIDVDQTTTLNQIFKGFSGAIENQQEIDEINDGGNPNIKVNYQVSAGDYSQPYTNLPPNQQIKFRSSDINSGGGGDSNPGGGGGPGGGNNSEDCSICLNNGGAAAALPLYLVYRYSKCNVVWYPPEYIFNYNPSISQGQGWQRRQSTGQTEYRSCDLGISAFRSQSDGGGAGGGSDALDLSCERSYYLGCYSDSVGCIRSPNCVCRDRYNFPCQCSEFPHISGGLVDTVKKQFNVSQKEFQGGFFPSLDPFLPKMLASESGCMSCYNSRSQPPQGGGGCDPLFEPRRQRNKAWPKVSGYGRTPQTIGEFCNNSSQIETLPFYNQNYNVACFNRGVSPYLNRLSRRIALSANDIINYGSAEKQNYEVLGPTYLNTLIQTGKHETGNNEWTSVKFKKTYKKKDLLFNKLVGLVGIDHHFECWAYHSKALFCPPPPIAFNHARVLITPYERPYAGVVKPTSFAFDARESLRFQILRSFPRGVVYGSSTVPIFYADIYAMEIVSQKKDIKVDGEYFNGEIFLENFYRYFYNMAVRNGETIFDEPTVFQEDVDLYNRVSNWLKLMMKHNILSVKDHAKDIADELTEVLDNATVITNVEGTITDVVFRDEIDDVMVGGKVGYNHLINYLYDLSGACGSVAWSNIKSYFSGKTIKQLINPLSNNIAPGQMFWAPRRVKLYPTPTSAGLTAWGCTAGGCTDYSYSPNNIPPSNWPINYVTLESGDRNWFAISDSGKLYPFGHQADQFCNTDSQQAINASVSMGCFPKHLGYLEELQLLQDPNSSLSDGQVVKITSKGNHAVALVYYNQGIVIGDWQGDQTGTPNERRIASNSGYIEPNTNQSLKFSPFTGLATGSNTENTAYVIRSWGEDLNCGIFYNSPDCISDYYIPTLLPFRGTNSNPYYYGQIENKVFAFKDVAAGAKHTVALTWDGALFMTPDSQDSVVTSYGYPTVSGQKVSNTSNTSERLNININSLVFYKNYPKPGYFTDAEWDKLYEAQTLTPSGNYFDVFKCLRVDSAYPNRPCDIRCYLYGLGQNYLDPSHDSESGSATGYILAGSTGGQIRTDTPVYTNVAAGHYHTIALSDDNNIKIWGYYTKIKPDGSELEVLSEDITGNTGISRIPVFLPTGEYYPDVWSLSGLTYGCRDVNPPEASNEVHAPYFVYTEANKTVYESKKIFAIDGGPDYSILARKEGTSDRFVIWGHAEMVESVSGSVIDGVTGIYAKNYDKIEKIIAGPNSVAVIYKLNNSFSTSTEIFVRKGRKTQQDYNFGFTGGLEGKRYSDISLTYGNAAGIYTAGLEKQVWKWSSFNSSHLIYQFLGNDTSLPQYFRSQAFFRAVPGRWEITKWLFGRPCHLMGTEYVDNLVAQPDPCSIYYQKGDINRSFSGIPQYYWMRSTWKRKQQGTPLHSYEPTQSGGCGLIRNLQNQDGLDEDDFGTGLDPGPLGSANDSLLTGFGTCFGDGDICWIGDGTPSPYPYYENSIPTSASTCECKDKLCGCPPSSKLKVKYSCETPTIGVKCFGYLTGRIGFNSNKDYFIQSAKAFGRLYSGDSGLENNIGCCGVVKTNITGFLYAKREYYYAYNSATQMYEVKIAPLAYRPVFVGNNRPAPGQIYGLTGSWLFNEIMVPKDAIISAYTVDNYIEYPKVYVGGENLCQLEKDYNVAKQKFLICPSSSVCNGEVCPDPNNPCSSVPSGCALANPVDLLGYGGWIHGLQGSCIFNNSDVPNTSMLPVVNGFFNNTVDLYEKYMTLPIVATDGWLEGMVNLKNYTGKIPPGLSASECWCGPTSAANPTGIGTCPDGRCLNGEQVCDKCRWCCGLQYGLYYELGGETGIDNPDLYYPGDKALPSPPSFDEPIPFERPAYKWYRVYEEIKSTYKIDGCPGISYGYTGAPIAFIGIENQNSPNTFEAECFCADGTCQIIGKTSDIKCDLYFNS